MITLNPEEVTKELFDTAQFFAYAGSGAMGDAGSVIIVTDEGETYYCNYVYGDVSPDAISKAFPVWQKAPFDLPNDWVFYDLGMGNSLLVRKKHQAKFEELAGGNIDCMYLYQNWHKFAVKICSDIQEAKVIRLSKKDIKKELFDRAQFFFWAEAGAMGDHGAVHFITEDGKSYYCNFVHGVSAKKIAEVFPVIAMNEFPEEWAHVYCGMGNHLLMRKKYHEKFIQLLGRAHPYREWFRVAQKILSSSN